MDKKEDQLGKKVSGNTLLKRKGWNWVIKDRKEEKNINTLSKGKDG